MRPAAGDTTLPVLSGLLLALAFPPVPGGFAVVFIALVPLLVTLEGLPRGGAGRWRATRAGLLTGVVAFGPLLYWMAAALLRHSLLAIPAWLGAVAILAGITALFALAVHQVRSATPLPLPVVVAVLWTGLEWARGHAGDLAFPWLGLGTALAPTPRLAGFADVAGVHGLTFWIAAVNGVAAGWIVAPGRRPGRAAAGRLPTGRLPTGRLPTGRLPMGRLAESPGPGIAAILATVLVLLAPAGYGVLRAATLELRPLARVALVQPNIPEAVKLGPNALDSSLTALTRLTRTVEPGSVALVAWPEVALPADLEASPALRRRVETLSREVGAPILVGAYAVEGSGRGRGAATHNAVFMVTPGGDPYPRYDKERLVPFVERVPFVGPGPRGRVAGRWLGSLSPGARRPLLEVPDGPTVGVLVCYEAIFGDLARARRAAGADLLVNATNDAWFGGEDRWSRTPALWQHPAHAVLRAIETRTAVARPANTGITMLIDPVGRVHAETPLFEPAVLIGPVYGAPGHGVPLAVRWGDWAGGAAALLAGLFIVSTWSAAARGLGLRPRKRARA